MKIAVVGTGYVGLVTGTCLAEMGHQVICVDRDQEKVKGLKEGVCPIFEPALEDYMKRNMAHERLHFTLDLASAINSSEMVFIAVGTPENEDGSADLSHVVTVAEAVTQAAERDLLMVVKSTVPVGTADALDKRVESVLAKRGNESVKIRIASNPEFLREGSAVEDFMHPERIIVGIDHHQREDIATLFAELYQPFIAEDPARLLVMDRRSCELTKYGANTMLASRITMMNELALLCEKVGANIDEIRRGMGSDSRIGKRFLQAGPGFGGSCFPKDVEALIKTSEQCGFDFKILKATKKANQLQKVYAVEKALKWLQENAPSGHIAIWGLAFKPGTDDVRESPALIMVEHLLKNTECSLTAYDPRGIENFARALGKNERISYREDAYQCLPDANALLVITDWAEFKRPSWEKVRTLMNPSRRAVFDFRNQYSFDKLSGLGFHYECIGRPDSRSSWL